MADRDSWEKAESLSKIFAAVFIPVVLGIASLLANQALEKSKTRDELLKQAIEVVFLDKKDKMAGDAPSFESRRAHRSHWVEIYNSLSDVKLSNEFIAITMEQDTVADEKNLYWTGNRPSLIPNTETRAANSTDEDELGHGWVAVGRLDSQRYSDLNFNVPSQAIERDGTIKPHEILRARWSVSLRDSTRNLEDRKGYSGSSRRSPLGRRLRQGVGLAGRCGCPDLGLHRDRAVSRGDKVGARCRAPRHVRRPFLDPVTSF